MDLKLLFAIVIVLFTSACAQDPEIVDEIWPEVKQVRRTARLNCTVVNKQNHVVTWVFLKTNEVISNDLTIKLSINEIEGGERKYEVQARPSGNRVTYMLIVRRLREQNAGIYQCYVRIHGSDFSVWPKKIGRLTVQVAPTIRPGDTTAVLKVEQFTNSSLMCDATGIPYPNITWTRSDGFYLPTGGAQFRGKVLPLISTTIEMGGVYRCVADNNIKPPAHHLAEVLVFHKPKVRVVQDSVGQAQNRRYFAKLECITQGYPVPNVRWERVKEGSRVPIADDDKYDFNKQTTDNQNLKAHEQWYTLKIKNVDAKDYTDYYCIATNTKGSAEKVITVFETTECQGPNCPSLPSGSSSSSVIIFPSVSVIIGMAVFQSIFKRRQ